MNRKAGKRPRWVLRLIVLVMVMLMLSTAAFAAGPVAITPPPNVGIRSIVLSGDGYDPGDITCTGGGFITSDSDIAGVMASSGAAGRGETFVRYNDLIALNTIFFESPATDSISFVFDSLEGKEFVKGTTYHVYLCPGGEDIFSSNWRASSVADEEGRLTADFHNFPLPVEWGVHLARILITTGGSGPLRVESGDSIYAHVYVTIGNPEINGGRISPEGTMNLVLGSNLSISILPSSGFRTSKVEVGAKTYRDDIGSIFIVENIQSNTAIYVYFERIP